MFKKTIAAICVAAMAAVPGIPANAAPLQSGTTIQLAQMEIQMDGDRRGGRDRMRRDRNWDDRWERRGDNYFFNGFRGYRDRRAGYRFYNGYWFPSTAFSFGITINADRDRGGRIRLSNRHIEWCEDRYRSYRAWDNTFQPYNGPRRQCISPFS